MKIMTFNTQHCWNYLEKHSDYKLIADTIKSFDPDIVGLNEIFNGNPHQFPDYPDFCLQPSSLSQLTGFKYYAFCSAPISFSEGPYGNALLSKYPITSVETSPIFCPTERKYNGYYEDRVLLKVRLENGFTVLVCHFGLNQDEAERAVETIIPNIESEKCILMGDFNVTPDNEVLNPIRERMQDTAEAFNKPKLSYPSDKPKVKIDYIFVSPDIEIVSADIPAIIASDHRPHIAEVNIY